MPQNLTKFKLEPGSCPLGLEVHPKRTKLKLLHLFLTANIDQTVSNSYDTQV